MFYFFFFKQKTAYEMRISDWSLDVCSSDLSRGCPHSHRKVNNLSALTPGKPPKTSLFVVAAALVDRDGRLLVQQRPEGLAMAGLWEFPGGKLEHGETPEQALSRELAEELAIDEIGRASWGERVCQSV